MRQKSSQDDTVGESKKPTSMFFAAAASDPVSIFPNRMALLLEMEVARSCRASHGNEPKLGVDQKKGINPRHSIGPQAHSRLIEEELEPFNFYGSFV